MLVKENFLALLHFRSKDEFWAGLSVEIRTILTLALLIFKKEFAIF